jgi:1-acyl-sn-glycerol-3-phosphate acyltransferase
MAGLDPAIHALNATKNMNTLRLWLRLVLFALWTLFAIPLQSIFLILPGRLKERFARRYWRGVRAILGIRISIHGALTHNRPAIFVVNHCSWLDIVVLGSVLPACFVAKGEIAHWPGFGFIAKLGRTIFVSRIKSGVERERQMIEDRLKAGDNIILFPEGTTSDGTRILRFQTAFLAVADAPAKPEIQLVTLVYDRINGLPIHRRDRPLISWFGDMTLQGHVPGVGRLRSIHATLVLDAAIPASTYPNRKLLSAALEQRLTANAAALRQGRPVAPLSTPALPNVTSPP